MIKKRNVLIEITKGFDADEKRLSASERQSLDKALNELVKTAREQPWPRKLYRSHNVSFPASISQQKSTLYMFRATRKYRVILTFDEDPIFNQRIIQLLRITSINESVEVFNVVASILYNKK
ncbi:MAG: hypothetical protein K5778_05555 [Bacteroidaceae bacterium]|nr:hypothetical protein [Bacteroidaceae bacterium]